MEMINILLAAIISVSGFPIGLLLAKIAKQELKQGRDYFVWIKNIILILGVIFVTYSFRLPLYFFLILGIIITLLIIKKNPKIKAGYSLFAILFIFSTKNTNLLIVISSLIFLYGFPAAALIKVKNK